MPEVLYRRHTDDCGLLQGYDCTCAPEQALIDEVDDFLNEIAQLKLRVAELEMVAEAAKPLLSEDGVREMLSCYVMGVELINRLEALEKDDA